MKCITAEERRGPDERNDKESWKSQGEEEVKDERRFAFSDEDVVDQEASDRRRNRRKHAVKISPPAPKMQLNLLF